MYRRYIYLIAAMFIGLLHAEAQPDSSCHAVCQAACGSSCQCKEVSLRDIIISCPGANDDPQLGFYKQNRLPATEEILGRMQGVTLIRRGDYGMEPALRCYSAGQINTTINGMKIFGACTDKMDPPTIYIEPSNLNSIGVTEGAAGCKYGSTIGGSMNMDIKEAQPMPQRNFYFTTASSYSSVNNGYNGSASLSSSGPKASFRVGAVYRKAFDYKEGGGATVLHSGYEKANVAASANFQLNPKQSITLDYIGDMGWNIGFPALQMDTRKANANIASVAYNTQPDRKVLKATETKVYFNYIYHLMDNSQRSDAPMQMSMPGWSYTAGAYWNAKLEADKNNQIELRADYYTNYTKASMTMYPENAPEMYMLTLPDNMRQFGGAYAGDEWHIAPKHILRFNVRNEVMHANLLSEEGKEQWTIFTDNTSTNKYLPSGSVEYSWLCARHLSLNLTGAYGSSAPTGNQLYGYYLFGALDNYDYIGNPALKSEKALQSDANIAFNDKIFSLSLTGYYHRIYDYIIGTVLNGYVPVTIGALGVKEYTNMPGAFITGADATASINLKQGIQSMNTFNYSYGTLSNGSLVPLLSPLRGINSVRYTWKAWHIQAETDWAMAKDRVNTEVGETTSPSYCLLNLRTGYQLVLHKQIWALNFSVENVLDEKYREYSDWGTVLRPGRNFVVYLSYSFGS